MSNPLQMFAEIRKLFRSNTQCHCGPNSGNFNVMNKIGLNVAFFHQHLQFLSDQGLMLSCYVMLETPN